MASELVSALSLVAMSVVSLTSVLLGWATLIAGGTTSGRYQA
jgi:hypothetical protein